VPGTSTQNEYSVRILTSLVDIDQTPSHHIRSRPMWWLNSAVICSRRKHVTDARRVHILHFSTAQTSYQLDFVVSCSFLPERWTPINHWPRGNSQWC